jgi:hypothetical protein
MTKRILLAGIAGGLALFLWGGFSHMVLRLGEVGVRPLPEPKAAVDALRSSVPRAGFYFFPPVDSAGKMSAEDMGGPNGILIYHPSGASPAMGRALATECILNIVQALIAAVLLSLVSGLPGYLARAGFVVLAGLLGGAALAIEHWNWYGFPTDYTLGFIADRLVGFFLVGLIVAAFVKPVAAQSQRSTARAA